MPEPGSKSYDIQRARRRKEAQQEGAPEQAAEERAKEEIEQDPKWRPSGPRSERGLGPKGERERTESGEEHSPEEQSGSKTGPQQAMPSRAKRDRDGG